MELVKLLQDGDMAGLEMEKAKQALEDAKQALDVAKEKLEQARSEMDQVLARGEEAGVPKAKLKKLIEERTAALWSSGLFQMSPDKTVKAAKPAKAPRKPKSTAEAIEEFNSDAAVEDTSSVDAVN